MIVLKAEDYEFISRILKDYYLNITIDLSSGGMEISINSNQKIIDSEEFEEKIETLIYDDILSGDDFDGDQIELSFKLEESSIICNIDCSSVSFHSTTELIEDNLEFINVITKNIEENSEYFQLDISDIGFEVNAVSFTIIYDDNGFHEFEVYYYDDLVTLDEVYKEKLKKDFIKFFTNEGYLSEGVTVEIFRDADFEINYLKSSTIEFVKE